MPTSFITPFIPCHSFSSRQAFLCPSRPSRRFRCRPASVPIASADWYKVLDVPSDADARTIKRAYRRAALKNHPDVSKSPDAKERFLRVQQAYQILSNESKRREYDRKRRRAGTSSESSWSGGGWNDGRSEDYARKWRENNPMPEDLNDNLSSILSDLFDGVGKVVGGQGGVIEDFVEFLERGVGGEGDVLRSKDQEVLEAEVEDAKFVVQQLKGREEKLKRDVKSVGGRVKDWSRRAERMSNDYLGREAARERERELGAEEKRLESRLRKTRMMREKEQARLDKLEKRLQQVKSEAKNKKTEANATRGETRTTGSSGKQAIDEELERMKRELGL